MVKVRQKELYSGVSNITKKQVFSGRWLDIHGVYEMLFIMGED